MWTNRGARKKVGGRAGRGYTALAAVVAIAAAFGASAQGCASDDKKSAGETCLSNRDFFATEVYPKVFVPKCLTCHSPDGEAPAQNAKFVIQPSSYPGFIDTNLALMQSKIVGEQYQGESFLTAKPLQHTAHGGGVQLQAGAEDTGIMQELVQRLQGKSPGCGDQPADVPAQVQQMDNTALLRRVSIQLVGRLPTGDEINTVSSGADADFDSVVLNMMNEQGFYDWLRTNFNDLLLTNNYFTDYDGKALDTVNTDDYPNINNYRGDQTNWTDKQKADRPHVNLALAREPVELMAYVARTGQPFGLVVSAPWTVVNPYLAEIYNASFVSGGFNDDPTDDDNEWVQATVTNAKGVAIPHAGVLTTPMWLNRHNTSPTNRSRGRAHRVMTDFLGTDILKIAVRPVDATAVASEPNPTLNDALCIGCHSNLDPIAGCFRGWGDSDYEHFDLTPGNMNGGTSDWYLDMRLPGFESTQMPPDQYPNALSWLGNNIAADPRLGPQAVALAYKAIMGRDQLEFPKDTTSPTFAADYTAYTTQQQLLAKIATAFTNGQDFRQAILGVIHTPYYKATNVTGTVDPAVIGELGDGRMITPEVLDRKITAIMGVPWRQFYEWDKDHNYFHDNATTVIYGGIDSENVVVRAQQPNGIMGNMAFRIASDVACLAVPYDFSKDPSDRILFGDFDYNAFPDDDALRKVIVNLFARMLGQTIDPADPEVDAAVALYKQTVTDGGEQMGADGKPLKSAYMQGPCGADPTTGMDLQPSATFRGDPTYTFRAWQAVVVYLMTDYQFLYE